MARLLYAAVLCLGVGPCCGSAAASKANQWHPWQANLTATGSYSNPYTAVDLEVTYTGPDGPARRALGFWDGDSAWVIRTFFDRPGRWQWNTTSVDPGLRQSGVVTVDPAPVRISYCPIVRPRCRHDLAGL